jgi:hypothetical protein
MAGISLDECWSVFTQSYCIRCFYFSIIEVIGSALEHAKLALVLLINSAVLLELSTLIPFGFILFDTKNL